MATITTLTHTNVPDTSNNIINVRLSWLPPYNGGYPINSYRIQYSLINISEYITVELILADNPTAVDPDDGGRVSYLMTKLIKGGIYQARVAAVNDFGSGVYSEFIYAYPGTVPSQLSVTNSEVYVVRGSTTVTVVWIEPYDGGYPITSYSLQYRAVTITGGGTAPIPVLPYTVQELTPWTDPPVVVSSTFRRHTFTGLLNGTHYQFRIAARNDVNLTQYCDPLLMKPGDIPGPFSGNLSSDFLASDTARNNGRIFLEWAPPVYNGGYDLENFVLEYRSANDVHYTQRILSLGQKSFTDYSLNNIIVDYYGDASSNPPIPITTPLINDISYSVRIGVKNDVGIRWLPNDPSGATIFATVIPGTFAKPVLDLSATIADGTSHLSWRWSPSLNNGYLFANYYVVRYRQYNDLYWHELVYPYPKDKSNKLYAGGTVNNYKITVAETGRDIVNATLLTNAVYDTSVNVYNYLDPSFGPFKAQQPLINGDLYNFQVAAVNHITKGPDTGIAVGNYAQVSQTPGRVPDAPALVKIQRTSTRATLTWTVPVNNGGYPVLSYQIRIRPESCFTTVSPALTASPETAASVVSSFNRLGVGVKSANIVLGGSADIVARYTNVAAAPWNSVAYTYTVGVDAGNTIQIQFPAFFITDKLFDVSIRAQNALGYGPELFMTDKYSTQAYKPSAPINMAAQLLKSSALNGARGAIFLNWSTPEYWGGTLGTGYIYEIQYALVTSSIQLLDDGVWNPLNGSPEIFSEYQKPASTRTPGTVITSLYYIFAGEGGMIGTSFIQWVRVRASATSSAAGSGGLSDTKSDWTVCAVYIIE